MKEWPLREWEREGMGGRENGWVEQRQRDARAASGRRDGAADLLDHLVGRRRDLGVGELIRLETPSDEGVQPLGVALEAGR